MLSEDFLAKNLTKALKDYLCPVFETALLELMPGPSEDGNDKAKQFRECLEDNLCENLAIALASCIDTYIKNADIVGTVLTTGSPFTQQAQLIGPPQPTKGLVPNGLKIV